MNAFTEPLAEAAVAPLYMVDFLREPPEDPLTPALPRDFAPDFIGLSP